MRHCITMVTHLRGEVKGAVGTAKSGDKPVIDGGLTERQLSPDPVVQQEIAIRYPTPQRVTDAASAPMHIIWRMQPNRSAIRSDPTSHHSLRRPAKMDN